ncbi:MAG: histidine phosphatase family protein [archaeon]|nr:histidine phosphatase family protein [archaeon]
MAATKPDRRQLFAKAGKEERKERHGRAGRLKESAELLREGEVEIDGEGLRSVFVLRHGERLDEVDVHAWGRQAQEEARTPPLRHVNSVWGDPPLTEMGIMQAERAAKTLAEKLERLPEDKRATKIYCSKLRRAAQTAVPLAKMLGLPIHFCSGLSASSAVVQLRGEKFMFLGMEKLQEVVGPDITIVDADARLQVVDHWFPPLEHVASREQSAVVVAHRESLRYLSNTRFATPYCCMGRFEFEPAHGTFLMKDLWDMDGALLPLPPTIPFSPFPRRRCVPKPGAQSSEEKAQSSVVEIEEDP